MADAKSRKPCVVFAMWQAGRRADGGLRSITEIMAASTGLERLVLTNKRGSAFSERWREAGIGLVVWPMNESGATLDGGRTGGRLARLVLRLVNNARMALFVIRRRVDLVHCNDIRAFWNVGPGARLAGARVILNVRDAPRSGVGFSARSWRFAHRLSDVFLVLSREMADRWSDSLGVGAEHFRYIYSIVDTGQFRPVTSERRSALRQTLGIGESTVAFVVVAGLSDKKRQLDIVRDVAPELIRREPRACLYLVGDADPATNPYARACLEAAETAGITDRVVLTGYTNSVEEWYQAADMVLIYSKREGLARCMIEGLASGAAIASVPVCSAREILAAHDCGLLVEDEAPEAFAGAVTAFAADPARLAACRVRGPDVARELFDAPTNAASYEVLVLETVGR